MRSFRTRCLWRTRGFDRMCCFNAPGAASRAGEIVTMAETLAQYYDRLDRVEGPGTMRAGMFLSDRGAFVIGISDRTNKEGARQLAGYLGRPGIPRGAISISAGWTPLHLKAGSASG